MKKYILLLVFLNSILNTAVKAQSTTPFRGALLEYFQGHTCPNCPRADSIAEFIKVKYGDSVALVNIHSGYWAQPDTILSFPFSDDLTCNTGEMIDTFFRVSLIGIPMGMISRKDYDTTTLAHLKFYLNWDNEVDSIVQQTPVALVDHSNNYNSTTRILNTTVYTQALINLTGNYYLSVFITEDSVISPMLSPLGVDTNHVNNNLLRTGINGTWGTLISSGTFFSGSIITNNYSFTIDTAWIPSHCKIVCFVYDNATKEVLQISQKALLDSSSSPLLIKEIVDNNIVNIFPNPFNSQTTITFNEEPKNATIIVTDVIGREIKTINCVGRQCTLEKTEMKSGIYFITITTQSKTIINKKIVIQ